MSDDRDIPLRERHYLLLDSDSEEKTVLFQRLSPNEQKALIYRFHTVPGIGRVDPDLTPPPPFPEPQMKRLLQALFDKMLQVELEKIDDAGS